MKTLVLDYKKWRCGQDGKYKRGKGNTQLNNPEGYMCCLGQFSLQLRKTLTPKKIIDKAFPEDLEMRIPFLTEVRGKFFYNTDLSAKAATINDDINTTPNKKIKLLKELFLQYGFEIQVINK